jgi:hypothetical protein
MRKRLRLLTGTCTILEGRRALKTAAPLGGQIESERTGLRAYIGALEEAALDAMQMCLSRKFVTAHEVEALLEKYPEDQCLTRDLKVGRRSLSTKQQEMTEQQEVVDSWRQRIMSMINSCHLAEAEKMLVELGTRVSSEMVLALAKEHSAMHMYVQQLRQEAIRKMAGLQNSGDIGELLEAIAESKDVSDPEVRALCSRLQARAQHLKEEGQTIGELRLELSSLMQGTSVEQIESALRRSDAFDEQLHDERVVLRSCLMQLLDAACHALGGMLSTNRVEDIDEALVEYRGYNDSKVRSLWRKLEVRRRPPQPIRTRSHFNWQPSCGQAFLANSICNHDRSTAHEWWRTPTPRSRGCGSSSAR